MSLPISVGIPEEVKGSLGYNLPQDCKSFQAKILPSNLSSITSGTCSVPISLAAAAFVPEFSFPSQEIRFALPTMQSPSMFLDTRMSSLTFRMTVTSTNATAPTTGDILAQLRSGANAFFDRAYVLGPSGNTLEDILEYGVCCDSLQALQFSNSDRDGLAVLYGFSSDTLNNLQGLPIGAIHNVPKENLKTGNATSHSFTVPIVSSVIGVTNDSFLNVGRLNSLQYILQTTNILPFAMQVATALTDQAYTFTVSLDNFSLNLEFIDIGMSALKMVDETLLNGVSYSHGTTYRTSTTALPSLSGAVSLLSGIRGSSIKSLFTRFQENSSSYNCSGKYNSKNPNINAISFSIGGIRYPQQPTNPLLLPANSFEQVQKAIGNFNGNQFQSSLNPSIYCRLPEGGNAKSFIVNSAQDYNYTNTKSLVPSQDLFIWGQNLEVVAKKGVLSGLNASSAPIFVEMNIGSAPTNAHNMIVIAMQDSILIHNVITGDLQVRL